MNQPMSQKELDEYFMRYALEEARLALEEGNWPIGAIIVLKGQIIARGRNKVFSMNDKTAHAEIFALKQVQDVLRNNKQQAILYSTYEPCPMCFGASILSRVKKIVSGVDLDSSGAMFFKENLPLRFRDKKFFIEFASGILADECKNVFMQSEHVKKLIDTGMIKQ